MIRVQPFDGNWPWLQQAAMQSLWEAAEPPERAAADPAGLARRAGELIARALGQPGATVLVGRVRGVPAGYIMGGIGPDPATGELTGHILDIWVHPAFRRRALTGRLHAALEWWFRGHGACKAKLWTGLHNGAAVACARSHGYVPEGIIGRKRLHQPAGQIV